MITIIVDYYYDDIKEVHNFVAKAKKNNFKCEIITMNGPGGGWPEISIAGSKDKLNKFMLKNYDSEFDINIYL